jgi:hypothetical protein
LVSELTSLSQISEAVILAKRFGGRRLNGLAAGRRHNLALAAFHTPLMCSEHNSLAYHRCLLIGFAAS